MPRTQTHVRPTNIDRSFVPELAPMITYEQLNALSAIGMRTRGDTGATFDVQDRAALWVGSCGKFEYPILYFCGRPERFKPDEELWVTGRMEPATFNSICRSTAPSSDERIDLMSRFALSYNSMNLQTALDWLGYMFVRENASDAGEHILQAHIATS
jgi:hypothetical protein